MRKQNLIDVILLEKVKNKPEEWRVGQALFNYAYGMYPEEVDKITGTVNDCFYDDSKIDTFLKELNKLLIKNI